MGNELIISNNLSESLKSTPVMSDLGNFYLLTGKTMN